MRWPFHPRRTAAAAGPGPVSPSGGDAAGAPGPGGAPDDPGAPRTGTFVPPRHDWAALPPIPTVVQAMPLTADSAFRASLAAGTGHLTLGPLTHHAGEGAPAGVVSGVPVPAGEPASPPAAPAAGGPATRTVSAGVRPPNMVGAEPGPPRPASMVGAEPGPPSPADPVGAEPGPPGHAAVPPPDRPAAATAPPPHVQRQVPMGGGAGRPAGGVPAVQPPPAGDSGADLSWMDPVVVPGPGPAAAGFAPAAPAGSAAAPWPAPLPPRRVAAVDAPCVPPPPLTRLTAAPVSADAGGGAPAAAIQRSVEEPAAAVEPAAPGEAPPVPLPSRPRLSLGQSRRLGLGPPLAGRPPVVASRTPDDGPSPAAGAAEVATAPSPPAAEAVSRPPEGGPPAGGESLPVDVPAADPAGADVPAADPGGTRPALRGEPGEIVPPGMGSLDLPPLAPVAAREVEAPSGAPDEAAAPASPAAPAAPGSPATAGIEHHGAATPDPQPRVPLMRLATPGTATAADREPFCIPSVPSTAPAPPSTLTGPPVPPAPTAVSAPLPGTASPVSPGVSASSPHRPGTAEPPPTGAPPPPESRRPTLPLRPGPVAQRRADHDAGNPPAAARVEDAGGELPMPPTPTLPPPGAEPPSPGGETLPALGRPGPSGASPEPRDEVPDGVAGGVDPPGPGRADGPPPALSWARTASPAAEEAVTLPPSLTPAALPPLPLPLTPRPGAGTLGGTPPPRPLLGAAAQRAIAPAGPAPIGPPARPQPAARPAEVPLLGERMPRLSVPPPPVEPPPAAVRTAVEAAVGADLGGVHVHRREAAAHAAAQLEAEAFTVGDDVHLPGRHGPLDSPPAASLLAHELTHVAQQRRLGAALPSESSDGGQRLEAEARSVQRAWESGTLPLAVRHEAGHGGDDPGTRGGDDTAHLIESMLQSGFATASADGLLHFSPPDLAGSGAAALPAGTGVQRAETSASSPAPAASGGAAGTGGDDAQLEDLAQRIYHHIRWRLRSELLVDRERAGLMTDLS